MIDPGNASTSVEWRNSKDFRNPFMRVPKSFRLYDFVEVEKK